MYSTIASKVEHALQNLGLETPMLPSLGTQQQKITQLEYHFTEILQILGLDLTNDSLMKTPYRLAKMYGKEKLSGMDYANFPEITLIKSFSRDIVFVKDIHLTSLCEHHFAPIVGCVNIAYYPHEYNIGLSKLNRIVDFFGKRPQIQERLGRQILVALQTILATQDVGVYIQATHSCVRDRGIEDIQSKTVTLSLGGEFLQRKEFYSTFLTK